MSIVTFNTNLGRRRDAHPRRIAYIVRGVEKRSANWVFDVAFVDADRNKAGVLTLALPVESTVTPKNVLVEYERGFYDNLHNDPLRADLLAAAIAQEAIKGREAIDGAGIEMPDETPAVEPNFAPIRHSPDQGNQRGTEMPDKDLPGWAFPVVGLLLAMVVAFGALITN